MLPNTAATDFYGISYFLLVELTLNQWVNDIKLTWQTLPCIIRDPVESDIRYYLESGGIW